MAQSFTKSLTNAARSRGGQPLLTHYRPSAGERTELSVASFANWVDKTVNLLDELGIDADSEVVLPVLHERPGHWMSLVWVVTLWQLGAAVRPTPRAAAAGAELAVIGPDEPQPLADQTLACSLHPWGLPLAGLPDDVLDYASLAIAQPDTHVAWPVSPSAPAWLDAPHVTFAELAALSPIAERVAIAPEHPWDAAATLWRAVLGGGSIVVVEGTADELASLATTERATIRPAGAG